MIKANPRWSPFVSFSRFYTGAKVRQSSSCAKCCRGSTNHTQILVENKPQNNTRHMTKFIKTIFYGYRIHVNGRKRNKRDENEASAPFRLFTHPKSIRQNISVFKFFHLDQLFGFLPFWCTTFTSLLRVPCE